MKDERENAVLFQQRRRREEEEEEAKMRSITNSSSDASGECSFFSLRIVFFASSGLQPKTFTLSHWHNGCQIGQCLESEFLKQ